MLFIAIFLCTIVCVGGTKISFTYESSTEYGEPCMTDCIHHECVIGFERKIAICYPGSRPGLQYYTTRERTEKDTCRSRCGKFENKNANDRNWCYVSDYEWDYCSPEMLTEIIRTAYTLSKGPCKDECSYYGHGYLWCNTYWGGWDFCEPQLYTYADTKTVQGLDCRGMCKRQEGRTYNWCWDSNQSKNTCAPPARNFSIVNSIRNRVLVMEEKDTCFLGSGRKKRQLFDKNDLATSGFVASYAALLGRSDIGLLTEYLNQRGNPITRYTVMPPVIASDATLPMVVSATITTDTLQPTGSRDSTSIPYSVRQNLQRMGMNVDTIQNNNDENGHLICYILGGPGEIYNFAPQTRRLNRGTNDLHYNAPSVWFDTEITIRDFVRRTRGSAEITVVVVYWNLPSITRPDGYAVDLALYFPNGSLYNECNDYYYSNHPEDGSD